MERFNIKRPFTKETYLVTLLQEFDISLLQADEYFSEKKNKALLSSLSHILNSNEEEDIWKCITLLHILTHGNSYGMIKKYCEYKNKEDILNDTEQNLLMQVIECTEEYKLCLLSALLYDDTFFNEVKGWYKSIDEEVIPSKPKVEENFDVRFRPRKFDRLAASPDVDSDGESITYKSPIEDIRGKYYGDLVLIEDEQERQLEARFQFKNKETKQIIDKVPCYLDIEVILNDNKGDNESKLIISLDRIMTKQATICSAAIYDIDLSGGFTVSNVNCKDFG